MCSSTFHSQACHAQQSQHCARFCRSTHCLPDCVEIQIRLYPLAFPFLEPSRVACHGRRVGKHPEVGFLWCPSVLRVIFSSVLFKTAYFTFSFQGCLPLFSPNPQKKKKISKSTLLLQFWSVFPVSQNQNVKAWHCRARSARSTSAQSPFPVWLCPFCSHSRRQS